MKSKKEEESYISKKEGKPSVTRGRISEYENGVKVFEPYNEGGEPTRRQKRKLNDSASYETEHKLAVTLQVPKDAADPYAQMAEEFQTLTKDLRKPGSETVVPREQCLYDVPGLRIWVNRERGIVQVMQELRCQPSIISDAVRLQGQLLTQIENPAHNRLIMEVWKQREVDEIIDRV